MRPTWARNWAGCSLVLSVVTLTWLLPPRPALGQNEVLQPTLRPDSIRVTEDGVIGTLEDGSDALLTLSPKVQLAAKQLLQGAWPRAGAAILLDVRSGRLLALEQFVRPGIPPRAVLTSNAPSASVFKLVTTTALLEHSDILPTTRVCFEGGEHSVERQHLQPPDSPTARCGRFGAALGFSRNAVFAQLATSHLRYDDLLSTAERFGLNGEVPFAFPVPVGNIQLPFNDLEFARAAAGFRDSTLTPLGVTHICSAIALGGVPVRMRLVASRENPNALAQRQWLPRIMKANTAWRLTRMMEVTVHSGTSLEAFTSPDGSSYLGAIRVAGKTGTLDVPGAPATVSWFTGFAPSRQPQVVVTVLLENSRVWRRRANEVARDLLRVYFEGQRGVTSPL